MVNRQELEALIYDIYGVQAEHPFARDPDTAVFRHALGRKWLAVIMKIPKCKLGINGEGDINIVNLKCADEIIFSMQQENGIYPAYHIAESCFVWYFYYSSLSMILIISLSVSAMPLCAS